MAGKPAATIGSMHVCPMVTGTVPHVGGPVSGPGAPNVLINGKPAALLGDMCVCTGPPDVIAQGNPTIFINGTPAVCMGDMTAHGGTITVGEPNVMFGTATPMKPAMKPLKDIPFPEIDAADRLRGGEKIKEAEQKINEVKEAAEQEENEGEPKIYNLQWVKEETIIRDANVYNQVTLRASVSNISDGETITFKVKVPAENNEDEEEIVELSGTVQDKKVEVVWEIEEPNKSSEDNTQES